MGQKANPLSLRLSHYPRVVSLSPTTELAIQNAFSNFFYKKGIFVNQVNFHRENKRVVLGLSLFLSRRSRLFTKYIRRAMRRSKRFTRLNLRKSLLKKSDTFKHPVSITKKRNFLDVNFKHYSKKFASEFSDLKGIQEKPRNVPHLLLKTKTKELEKLFNQLNASNLCFSMNRCKPDLKCKKARKLWQFFKMFTNYTFRTKDFVKDLFAVSVCLLQSAASASLFSALLVKSFDRLPKKEHRRFLFFIKKLLLATLLVDGRKTIRGFRLQISGRFGGKPRAKLQEFTIGRVSSQTLNLPIDYAYKTSCTTLGSFGFKLFIAKNVYNTKKD